MKTVDFQSWSYNPAPDYEAAMDTARDLLADQNENVLHATLVLVKTEALWNYQSRTCEYTFSWSAKESS